MLRDEAMIGAIFHAPPEDDDKAMERLQMAFDPRTQDAKDGLVRPPRSQDDLLRVMAGVPTNLVRMVFKDIAQLERAMTDMGWKTRTAIVFDGGPVKHHALTCSAKGHRFALLVEEWPGFARVVNARMLKCPDKAWLDELNALMGLATKEETEGYEGE